MASIVKSDDFTQNALAQNGVTVSRTPVTTTFSGNGDEVRADGTPENITAIFHKRIANYNQNAEGLVLTTTGYIMTAPTQSLNRNDKITYDGETYRVQVPITRGPNGDVALYTYAELELIES